MVTHVVRFEVTVVPPSLKSLAQTLAVIRLMMMRANTSFINRLQGRIDGLLLAGGLRSRLRAARLGTAVRAGAGRPSSAVISCPGQRIALRSRPRCCSCAS